MTLAADVAAALPTGPASAPGQDCTRRTLRLLHPNLAEVYRQKVAALHEAPGRQASRDQWFELTRSLMEKVVLTPVNGELEIDLHGELAGI